MEKKNTGLIVLVVILSILVVGLGTIVVYDKVLSKENIQDEKHDLNNNHEKEESYIEQNRIVKKTELLLKNIPLINKYEEKIIDFNTIDNKDKLLIAIDYIARQNNSNIYKYKDSLNIDKINTTLKEIFNTKITFNNEDIMCCDEGSSYSHCHITYDKQNNQYICGTGEAHGYDETKQYYSKLVDFKEDNNKYELTYIYLFDIVSEGGYFGDTLYTKYINNNNNPYINFTNDEFNNMYEIYNKTGKTEEEQIKEIVTEKMENLDNYNEFPKYKYIIELDKNNNPKLSGYEFINAK